MKKIVLFVVLVIILVGAGIGFGMFLAQRTSSNMSCADVAGVTHTVTIDRSAVQPTHTIAKRCDQLTIINHDGVTREMAFGDHDKHVSYDGITQKFIGKDQSLTVVLDKIGDYHFHDHLHDEVSGTFTVQ
jgi:hypothetical protein